MLTRRTSPGVPRDAPDILLGEFSNLYQPPLKTLSFSLPTMEGTCLPGDPNSPMLEAHRAWHFTMRSPELPGSTQLPFRGTTSTIEIWIPSSWWSHSYPFMSSGQPRLQNLANCTCT
ncbi:predicted protein [Coccidioides posadasii str. Silveira]|uniref:Predicted protein n=2 Tax=Coccidioides posadasii TaxID=199306 RepID=E9DDD7_COCPS|nr:predicted protein [Coccidioides posadasii str. Silveira]KMM65649.1 hypothetical protein CPAG_01995 [Coccidioides posadasii RMSCC 3488]